MKLICNCLTPALTGPCFNFIKYNLHIYMQVLKTLYPFIRDCNCIIYIHINGSFWISLLRNNKDEQGIRLTFILALMLYWPRLGSSDSLKSKQLTPSAEFIHGWKQKCKNKRYCGKLVGIIIYIHTSSFHCDGCLKYLSVFCILDIIYI